MPDSRRVFEGEGFQARGAPTADHEFVASKRTGSNADAATVACLQERVVILEGEDSPLEIVGTTKDLGSGWYALMRCRCVVDNTVSKWKIVRLVALGIMWALWLRLCNGREVLGFVQSTLEKVVFFKDEHLLLRRQLF